MVRYVYYTLFCFLCSSYLIRFCGFVSEFFLQVFYGFSDLSVHHTFFFLFLFLYFTFSDLRRDLWASADEVGRIYLPAGLG